jgi:4-amino-4-deoxy-L-arabinose transferase-like glycosyltransferase
LSAKRLSPSTLELILLCAVLLLAAWLRFHRLDQAEFLWDQAEISKWALSVARQGRILPIGPISSTGLDTFPGVIWLLAIPYALSTSPVFATGFVAAVNLIVVIGCYFLARHWFGRTAALVATLLFAVAPWAVIYSRKIWHTTLLPPVVLLYVVTGWLAFVRGRRWALLAHCLALATLIQFHFSTLPFVLLTIVWALIFRTRLDWRLVPLGGALAALTFVPYLTFDARHGWRNVQHVAEMMHRPATTSADALYGTWIITTGQDLGWLTGPDRYPQFVAATPNVRWLFAAVGVLAVAGGVLALGHATLWRVIRRARKGLDDETAAALMATTWLAMPALFFTRGIAPPAPHYFTTTLPAQFILAGWLVAQVGRWMGQVSEVSQDPPSLSQRLPRRIGRIGQGVLVALLVILAALQTYEVTALLRFVTTHDTRQGYGTPIHYEIKAVQTATRLGQEIGSTEVILLSAGDEPRMYEMPNVADILLYGAPHRSVDVRTALVIPARPAVYWATFDVTPGEALLASAVPEVVEARISLREAARSYRFYRWPGGHFPIPDFQPLLDGPYTWANGARLIGYSLTGDLRPGGTIHWTLVWQATRTPAEDVYYHWFNHLLDERGQLQSQQDGPSLLPAYWRSGDTVLNWFDLPVPADAPSGNGLRYRMRVGMYAYPALQNVPVLGANGSPQGEWVEIELPHEEAAP